MTACPLIFAIVSIYLYVYLIQELLKLAITVIAKQGN